MKKYTFSVRRWVVWTFESLVGIGAAVLVNLAVRPNVTAGEVRFALTMGGMFWILFGFVAWAADGVQYAEVKNHAAEDHSLSDPHTVM